MAIIKNIHGSQSLSYKIFGSLKETEPDESDGSWINLLADPDNYVHTTEKTITFGNYQTESSSIEWRWIMIQIKGSGASTTGSIWIRILAR